MTLDREEPTPPISDEDAGRIGFRRMSLTPIPQVAMTAAEVADSAAILDRENAVSQLPTHSLRILRLEAPPTALRAQALADLPLANASDASNSEGLQVRSARYS